MNKSQRSAHKIVWILLTMAIPFLMYFSVQNQQHLHSKTKSTPQISNTKATVEQSFENELMKAVVRENQLFITFKSPLKSAASLVYAIDTTGKSIELLGQVTKKGSYVYTVSPKLAGIRVLDPIKNTEISKLIF